MQLVLLLTLLMCGTNGTKGTLPQWLTQAEPVFREMGQTELAQTLRQVKELSTVIMSIQKLAEEQANATVELPPSVRSLADEKIALALSEFYKSK